MQFIPSSQHFRYNVRNELIVADEVSYNYDDIGNRTTAEGKTYTVNNLNQYTAIDDFAPQYDDDGNQSLIKTETGTWSVVYNAENRPIRWQSGDTVITMAFDRMGRRVEMRTVKNGAETLQRFVYDNYLCVQQLRGADNALFHSYVWDPTEPIATRPLIFIPSGGEVSYYFHDGNKNVSDLVPTSGISVHYDYTPFGTPIASSASDNLFRFSSEFYDNPLALTYYNYRHYNSSDGRWNRKDSLGEKISQNQYSFIINSPISLYDWLGCIGISTTVGGPLSFSPEPSSEPSFEPSSGENSLILCYAIRAALFGLSEFDTSGRTLLPVNEVGRQIYNTWISGGGELELSPDDFDANNVARDAAQSVIAQEAAHWNPDLKCGETSTMTASNRRLKGGATSTLYAIRGYDFSYSFTLSRHKECDENDCCLKITTNTSYTFTFNDEFVFRDEGTFAGIIRESYVRDCAAHYNWGVGTVRSRATATNTQTNEESCN